MDRTKYFEELNQRLAEADLKLTLIIVGGYVLELRGLRATQDVDAFYQSSKLLDQIIMEIGEKYDINLPNENWLNNSVSNVNVEPDLADCNLLRKYSNLTIYTASLEYVLYMKAQSARLQDIKDMGTIIQELKLDSPKALEEKLIDKGFTYDQSDIYQAFVFAYGMDWLSDYLSNMHKRGHRHGR
ncbi:DUF6036 family nucleotidyltransferase [Lancefieldella rimae]|uniref:DUF6036 family nucleotidyltransferase n=1 Tax=Lancefieldella rimae TaxID=1383 RepID=UPI003C6F9537